MIGEYLLDKPEIDKLIDKLNEIKQKEFKVLFDNISKSAEQETVVRDFLTPHFDTVITERSQFSLPSAENMIEAMADLMES